MMRQPASSQPAAVLYGPDQGLSNVSGGCLLQGQAGYLLACSEHGLYQYDGRRFVNLGPAQGLRPGGVAYALVPTTGGRVALAYNNAIFVSDQSAGRTRPWTAVHFSAVAHPGVTFSISRANRLAAWRGGFVVLTTEGLRRIVVPERGDPFMAEIGFSAAEAAALVGASAVFAADDQLWVALEDGRLCAADPGRLRCFGAADGLSGGPWLALIAAGGGTIVTRSTRMVATFDPVRKRFDSEPLPDQSLNRYGNYGPLLGLFRLPGGGIATQSDHGLALREAEGWQVLPFGKGLPDTVVAALLTDTDGDVWLSSMGEGVMRWIGYGRWDILGDATGPAGGLPWQTARAPDGRVWVATDTGTVETDEVDGRLGVSRSIPGSAFVVAIGPEGRVWSSRGSEGLRVIDPATGTQINVTTPPVDAMLTVGPDAAYVGTEAGLWRVPVANGVIGVPSLVTPTRHAIVAMVPDRQGGFFYLDDGLPRHHHRDGTDRALAGYRPDETIEPVAVTFDRRGELWIGGEGGLLRLRLDGDRVILSTSINAAETRTNSIVALMTDHRGWVWVGTGRGVSVFDGSRWVSVDAAIGLASNDVSQGGLREDPDGTVWIATRRGLSHMLDPDRLFADPDIQVVLASATVGGEPLSDLLPYSRQPVELRFGTTSYARERSIVFRYRLSGVDADWATTASGAVHYPFLPPGRHVLEVVARDELSRRSSPPVQLDMDMAYPWWRQWWFELAMVLAAAALFQGLMQLRLRLAWARQAELRRLVDEATAEMRAAQEQLRHQAQHDTLTGLLTRSEIERRLAARLDGVDGDRELAIALMDIDHFKSINDGYGHLGGDDVLRSVGMLVAGAVHGRDEAGRYGGEEILLVLDDHDGRSGERILTLHRLIRGTSFTAAGRTLRVTCSVGVAWARQGDDWETLIGRADEALYEAKRTGRDRVVEARQPDGDDGSPVERRRSAF